MLTAPLSFPENIPDGYVELPETQVFDAGKHLQLEFPDQIWSLEDFGYSPEDIAKCASDVAVTSPFRLLSNLGVEDLYQVTVNLQDHQTNAKGARNPAHLAGGGVSVKVSGNMVVHRAARLQEPAERITLVPGLVSNDVSYPDPTAKHDMTGYNEPGIESELARHSARLAQAKLENLIDSISSDERPEVIREKLQNAVHDVNATVKYLEIKARSESWV